MSHTSEPFKASLVINMPETPTVASESPRFLDTAEEEVKVPTLSLKKMIEKPLVNFEQVIEMKKQINDN